MGFLSFLFGSKPLVSIRKEDRVFLTRKAANNDILNLLMQSVLDEKQVLLIYFFKETKRELDDLLSESPNVTWVNGLISGSVKLNSSRNINNTIIVLAETYPDSSIENSVLLDLEEAGFKNANAVFFNGIDDAVFVPFGNEKLAALMTKLGLKEDEPIEHPMITKSIERAQKKLTAKKLIGNRIDSRAEMIRQITV